MTQAVKVKNRVLVHTTQLRPAKSIAKELEVFDVLKQLGRVLKRFGATRGDIAKLNFYVTDDKTAESVRVIARQAFAGKQPAMAFVRTRLPSQVTVACDAVFATTKHAASRQVLLKQLENLPGKKGFSHAGALPQGDVVYVSGQAARGNLATATQDTLKGLLKTLRHLKLDRQHIVAVKTFMKPMSQVAIVDQEIQKFFKGKMVPPVSHVEWISGSLPIEIELIAYAPPAKSKSTVTYLTPPWMRSSPVFSRVARIHGNERIYVAGLVARESGNGKQQVESVFQSLKQTLAKAGSDVRHLAKATYYVADADASRQLNVLRPSIYDPKRPPAASKAMVRGVAASGRTLLIDIIAAPVR